MTATSKLVRYLLGGLLIGAFWYTNRDQPPTGHSSGRHRRPATHTFSFQKLELNGLVEAGE